MNNLKKKRDAGAKYPNIDCLKVPVLHFSHLASSSPLSMSEGQFLFL